MARSAGAGVVQPELQVLQRVEPLVLPVGLVVGLSRHREESIIQPRCLSAGCQPLELGRSQLGRRRATDVAAARPRAPSGQRRLGAGVARDEAFRGHASQRAYPSALLRRQGARLLPGAGLGPSDGRAATLWQAWRCRWPACHRRLETLTQCDDSDGEKHSHLSLHLSTPPTADGCRSVAANKPYQRPLADYAPTTRIQPG